jgi:xanthine/uracil permease
MRGLLYLGLSNVRSAMITAIGLVVFGIGCLIYSFISTKPEDHAGYAGAFVLCLLLSLRFFYRVYRLKTDKAKAQIP